MKTSIERISRNDGGSEKTRNTRRNGPKSNEEPASSSKTKRFLSSAYFSRGSPRGRLPFRLFLPTSHSLSLGERVKGGEDWDREWWSGFDRSWDWFEFKKRERKKGKEGRTIEKGEFNTGKMVGLFMKMAFFVEVRWVSTPLLLALERARWTLAISN